MPAGAPAVCEEFRKQPDALERAAELDRQYGRNPDLAKLPMYCAVFSLKDWYDAKDMAQVLDQLESYREGPAGAETRVNRVQASSPAEIVALTVKGGPSGSHHGSTARATIIATS